MPEMRCDALQRYSPRYAPFATSPKASGTDEMTTAVKTKGKEPAICWLYNGKSEWAVLDCQPRACSVFT